MQYKAITIGQTVRGQEILGYLNQDHAQSYIYLIAGVHGDEPEGVFVLEQLFSWLKTQNFSTSHIIIPVLNPDGLATNNRVNSNGVDLNRNWPTTDWAKEHNKERYFPGPKPLSEPENIALLKVFEKYKPKLIISFHSWQPMLDCNARAREIAEYIAQFNNYKVVNDIGYPTPGSLGTYAEKVLQCGILTYELPEVSETKSLKEIWQENEQGLKNYFLKMIT
jgi:protein MpaA